MRIHHHFLVVNLFIRNLIMLKTFLKTTALFFLLSTSFSSFGTDSLSPKQLLLDMKKAAEQLNYEFSFVQTTPSNMDSLRYRHFKSNGKTFAQLVTLDGAQQEIVQRDNLIAIFNRTINLSPLIVQVLPIIYRPSLVPILIP